MYIWMPISPKLPITFLFNIDYQAVSLNNNQIEKKYEYIFIILSKAENYKE